MNIDEWTRKVKSLRDINNIFHNFRFETEKEIARKAVVDAFEKFLSLNNEKEDSSFLLEYFCQKFGLVKISGTAVEVNKFGGRLSTVVKWFVAKDTLLVSCIHDPGFEDRLEALHSIGDQSEYIREVDKLSQEIEESLKDCSAGYWTGGAAGANVGSVGKSFATTTVTIAPPDPVRIDEPQSLTVCWLAPENKLNEKIESTVSEHATPSDKLVAAINVLGLKPDRRPYDLRFVFTFDGTTFPAEAVRRPTIFAGGFPECYLSADESDGWGRTGRLDNGVGKQACEEGVPEAVSSGLPLRSAANINLIGFLTASQYDKCGRPNPSLAAKKRFGEDFCRGQTA